METVTIDPLTLFLRLIVIVERKPENKIINYFNYELSPYPMSSFKDGMMPSSQMSKPKTFLLKDIPSVTPIVTTRIADSGALLWYCNWKKNDEFFSIFEKYSSFLTYLQIHTVVFDGYVLSTKDSTHAKRAGRVS